MYRFVTSAYFASNFSSQAFLRFNAFLKRFNASSFVSFIIHSFTISLQRYGLFLKKPHNLPILTCFTEVSQNRGNDLESPLHQDHWLDNQDLSQLLHISVRSLQRYRSLGILPYKMMHKKAYYTKEGVLQFLNSNVVSYDREEVALYFAKLGIST